MRPVVAIVGWWVRLYTAGLPAPIRDARRAELWSDLWEQSRGASGFDPSGRRPAASILGRWILGLPDDFAWRAEHRTMLAGRSRAGGTRPVPLGSSRMGRVVLVLGVAVALALLAVSVVANTIQYNEGTQPTGEAAALLLVLAASIAVLGEILAVRGFWVMGARPADGALMVAGGSAVAGLAWYWLLVPVVMAIALSAYAIGRARRSVGLGGR